MVVLLLSQKPLSVSCSGKQSTQPYRIAGAPLRLLPVSNSWVGKLLVSWVEQVEAMSVCRAKLIFLFLLASRASLPSSLMDGSSLGRLFPCLCKYTEKQCNVFYNLIKLHFTLEKWPGSSVTAWVWNMTTYEDVAKILLHAYSPELEWHIEAQSSASSGRKMGKWGHLAPQGLRFNHKENCNFHSSAYLWGYKLATHALSFYRFPTHSLIQPKKKIPT